MTKKRLSKIKKARILRSKKLAKKYGEWIVSRDRTGKKLDYEYSEYDAFSGGWALLWHMCIDELSEELHKNPKLMKKFHFIEIKEKFGEMRIYVSHNTKAIDEIIDKYSFISRYVCSICGKPDSAQTKRGWIISECAKCYEWRMKEFNKEDNFAPYEEIFDIEHAKCPDFYMVKRLGKDGGEIINYDIKETVDAYRELWERRHSKCQ